jgi:hypothetical protein
MYQEEEDFQYDGELEIKVSLNKAQLKQASGTSALMAGFGLVALIELDVPRGIDGQTYTLQDNPIVIIFGLVTSITVFVHLLALMIATCIYPHVDSIQRDVERRTDRIRAESEAPLLEASENGLQETSFTSKRKARMSFSTELKQKTAARKKARSSYNEHFRRLTHTHAALSGYIQVVQSSIYPCFAILPMCCNRLRGSSQPASASRCSQLICQS